MIVILMNSSEVNKAAVAKLSEIHKLTRCFVYPNIEGLDADEEVTIVDLDANGSFQTISKEVFSRFLVQNNLIKNHGVLNLLVSNVAKGKNIAVYAAALVNHLQVEYEIYLEARFIEDLNYNNVFISPPASEKDTWKVFGVDNDFNCSNYNGFFANAQKVLIWEGHDIIEWCVQEHTVVKNVRQLSDGLNIGDAYQISL